MSESTLHVFVAQSPATTGARAEGRKDIAENSVHVVLDVTIELIHR